MKSRENSSSSDEDVERFKEVVNSVFICDNSYNKSKQEEFVKCENAPKSMRYLPNEEQQVDVRVSSQMQQHIGKRLSRIIRDMVEYVEVGGSGGEGQNIIEGGVKLFRDSNHFLTCALPEEVLPIKENRKKIKKRIIEHCDDVDLSNVAVSGEDVLSGVATKHWKSRRKSKVDKYQMCNGRLVAIQ